MKSTERNKVAKCIRIQAVKTTLRVLWPRSQQHIPLVIPQGYANVTLLPIKVYLLRNAVTSEVLSVRIVEGDNTAINSDRKKVVDFRLKRLPPKHTAYDVIC